MNSESEEYKLDQIQSTLEKSSKNRKRRDKNRRPTAYLDTSNYNTYFTEEDQNFNKGRIMKLFDWNFGKDWTIYLFLDYSLARGHHKVRYNAHHPQEDLSIAFVMRQAHFAKACLIIHSYLTKGFEETQSLIRLNQFRIVWRGQYLVSSEIVNKLEEQRAKALSEGRNPDSGPLPIIAIEKADGFF